MLALVSRRLLHRSAGPRNGLYHGWIVVVAGILCSALSSPGQSFLLSLYLEPLLAELELSRVTVSTLYGASTLAAALCLPFVGRVADNISGRAFLTSVVLLLAGALVLLGSASGLLTLAIALFALRLLGQGAIGLGTMTTTVRWFWRYRARALAIVALGYPLGEIVFPGVVYSLMEAVGWRRSLFLIAAAYVLVFAPLIYRLVRERQPHREPLDGWPRAEGGLAESAAVPETVTATPLNTGEFELVDPTGVEASFTMREALGMPVFWGALTCVAAMPMVLTGIIFHQVAIFQSVGWTAAMVPVAFLAYAITGVVANVGTGFALERIESRVGIMAGNVVALLAFAAAFAGLPSIQGALVYGALLGAAGGIAGATNAVLWPDYFGIASLGAIKGVVSGVRNGATAIGPPLVAALMVSSGSARPALLGVGALLALSAAGALFLRRPGTG